MDQHLQYSERLTQVCQDRDACSDNAGKSGHCGSLCKGLQCFDPPDIGDGEDQHAACCHSDEELKASHVQSPGEQVIQICDH